MGIKNLNKFLREKTPEIFEPIHLSEYAFKKVAIDISLYLFKFKAVCGDRWLYSFLQLICSLRRNEIHCIFVYDGKAPPEKESEKAKRKSEKEKLQKQVYELETALDEYYKTGVIDPLLRELYKKRKSPQQKRLLGINKDIDINWLEYKIKQKRAQIIDISHNDFAYTKELFDILKVPYLTAPMEAEKMCSKLCIDGLVDAVLSEDTDIIAYGTPLFLSKIDTQKDVCIRINHSKVLENLEFTTKNEFLDLCIMCGTDYNDNIYKVGPNKSYQYLKQYNNIENIIDNTSLDTSILNYERVRELFTIFEDYNINNIDYCGTPDFIKLEQFFTEHNININMEKIKENFTREIIFEEDSESE
jgi:5'-3' exonuclease